VENLTPDTIPEEDSLTDLQRRVHENVAALYAGEVLPHTFTEEESLALRPRSYGFGIQPNGRVVHCGNAIMDMTELDIDLWNDAMRIKEGFAPENDSDEFRARVRADASRRRREQEEWQNQIGRSLSSLTLTNSPRRWYQFYRFWFLVVSLVLIVIWRSFGH
jgi:hypothetical protein